MHCRFFVFTFFQKWTLWIFLQFCGLGLVFLAGERLLAGWLVDLRFFCKTGRQLLLPFLENYIDAVLWCQTTQYPSSSVHSVVTVFIRSLIRKQHQVRPDPRHCRQRAPPQQRWDPRARERPHLCNSASASKQQPETQCTRSSMEV